MIAVIVYYSPMLCDIVGVNVIMLGQECSAEEKILGRDFIQIQKTQNISLFYLNMLRLLYFVLLLYICLSVCNIIHVESSSITPNKKCPGVQQKGGKGEIR